MYTQLMYGLTQKNPARISQLLCRIGCTALIVVVSACAHDRHIAAPASANSWIQEVVDYRQHLSDEQQFEVDQLLAISPEMRDELTKRFARIHKLSAAEKLTRWLLAEDGHGMRYDVSANFSPIQAFEAKRGNCLSFTLLLHALAKELDINIEFNAVDIPDTWGFDEQLGMVFYRHINGVLKLQGRRQVFDLAMDIYETGYPQRVISVDQALALLQNNKAVDHLAEEKVDAAIHPLKLAVSLSPANPDLWANLGVVMKRKGNLALAELAFTHALKLDKYSIPAASNLERIYREQGQPEKAAAFEKLVQRAHKSNPYHHYQLALEEYQQEHYKGALRSTNRAISLHNQDPRFYELKSQIAQQQGNYVSALKSLEKAYKLSVDAEQRGEYLSRAESLSEQAGAENAKRWRGNQNNVTLDRLQSTWY